MLQILGALLVVVVLPVGLMHALAGKLGAAAMILGLTVGLVLRLGLSLRGGWSGRSDRLGEAHIVAPAAG